MDMCSNCGSAGMLGGGGECDDDGGGGCGMSKDGGGGGIDRGGCIDALLSCGKVPVGMRVAAEGEDREGGGPSRFNCVPCWLR